MCVNIIIESIATKDRESNPDYWPLNSADFFCTYSNQDISCDLATKLPIKFYGDEGRYYSRCIHVVIYYLETKFFKRYRLLNSVVELWFVFPFTLIVFRYD